MNPNILFKISTILFLYLLLSCSDSEDLTDSNISINPPEWIQGTWMSGSFGFRFENDDFTTINSGTEISYKEQLEFYYGTGEKTSAEETETDETYRLKLTFPPGQSTIYEYSKKSETVIVWENQTSKPEFTKQ